MVVGGNFGGELGFFVGIIDNLVLVADPTTGRCVDLIRVQMMIAISHSVYIMAQIVKKSKFFVLSQNLCNIKMK